MPDGLCIRQNRRVPVDYHRPNYARLALTEASTAMLSGRDPTSHDYVLQRRDPVPCDCGGIRRILI